MRRSGLVPLVRLRSGEDSSDDESTISQASSSRGASCGSAADHGGSEATVRIKHLTRASLTGRFPKLDECAHFHYENVELSPVVVELCEESPKLGAPRGPPADNEAHWFCLEVTSHGQRWQVRRSYDNFRMLDRQLHRCVFDRKYSQLAELPSADPPPREMLEEYLARFSALSGGGMITCGPVLNWLELDNRGHRLLVTDEAALNTPAVAAAYVVRPHMAQAADEISFNIGDMISVIDMPPPEESTWWRGKKGFQVGFFPSECVEVIGEKIPHTLKVSRSTKPVLRRHGKLIAFFRSFLLSRPSRRKLKQTGILKERVFGCDLGEHLQNTGRDIPLVLEACTEFLDEFGIVDGIYRLSGINSNIQKLRVAFDEDTVPDLRGDEAIMQDIHCVASLLKMYFRELPNPLLTYQLYEELVASVSGPEEGRLARLRGVVRRLPPPHYRTLRHLLLHLARVAAHGHTTGMTPRNVAIVWAPNLLRSRSVEAGGGVAALHVIGIQAVLTEYLIRYADILFSHRAPALSPAPADSGRSRGRPKSLAVCTTRLLTLEEARSRVLAPQHFIDVGGGPPPRYHTILELPKSAKKSGWKSFFTRHSSTSRKHSGGSLLPTSPTAALQDQTILASKSLRPVKSAESLVLLSGSSCRNSREEEEEESFEGSRQSSVKSSQSRESSGTIQKHGRSTSHDSYFDHPTTFELSSPDSPRESKKQKLDDRTVVERYGNKDTVIVEVHATHEPEKSSMEDDDEMFEEPIFIQRLSPISLPQLEQLCSGSTSQLHCETMDSSPEDIPFLPQQHSSEDTDPRPEGESSCAKSQSLLSSNDCSLKTTSFFFDSRVANPEVERPPREPDNPCKYPSPTDALSSSSSSTSTEGAGALLPSSSDLHIHEEEESPPCIEEGMLVDTKSSPLSLHFEPSQSSSNLELSTPESPPPHRDFLPHSEKPHVYLHSPNSMATSSQSSESLHSSHSSSQQSEAIPSLQDLTAFIGSSEALPSEKQGSDRQLQCTLHRDTQQSPPLQVAMHSEAQQIPPLLATQEFPSEDTLHSEKQPPILSTLQSEITSPNQFTVQNEQYFPLQSTLQNELYSPSQSPVKTESQSTPQTEHYSPIQTELPSQPAVATELCTVHAELYFPPQSSPETELHSSSQSPVQTESDSPVETEICPSPQFPSVQAGLHSPDSTMDDATTQSEVHSQSTIPSSDSSPSPSPTHQVTPRQVDTGRSSNFRELFSKFEHSNTPNPPAALPDKVKPQLSLFTQLKILKLQSLSSPVAQSPQYDPWNNPILDRLNQEEVCSPTEPKVEQPPVLAKEPVKPVTSPVKETPPPQPKENNTPTTPKVTRESLKEVVPPNVKEQQPPVESSDPMEEPLQRTEASEEERTRRERINRIKEARRAQLREKLKLEHLLEPTPEPASYRLRRSWTRPGEAEGEDRPPTSRYLRASIR